MSAIERYFDNLEALLTRTRQSQAEAMETAARRIADSLKQGGMKGSRMRPGMEHRALGGPGKDRGKRPPPKIS